MSEDVQRDVTMLMLLGQMLAASGWSFPREVHPIITTRQYLPALPRKPSDAVKDNMWRFREVLLGRFGLSQAEILKTLSQEAVAASGDHLRPEIEREIQRLSTEQQSRFNFPRLYAIPEDLAQLLAAFDSAQAKGTATELDLVLDKTGLRYFDRSGKPDCLDLRSVFMDHLIGVHGCRDWGVLPIESIRDSGKGRSGGLVRQFITKLFESADASYREAAEHVFYNSCHLAADTVRPFRYAERPGMKLLALLFATVEEARCIQLKFRRDLALRWDPVADEPLEDFVDSDPTLEVLLVQLSSIMSRFSLIGDERLKSKDNYYPLNSESPKPSIRRGIESLLTDLDGRWNALADQLDDCSNDERNTILRNLLKRLEAAGIVTRERRGNERSEQDYYRLIEGNPATILAKYPRVDRVAVARRLGFWVDKVTNELSRTIGKDCGLSKEFEDQLLSLRVPEWMKTASRWYLGRYHPGEKVPESLTT
jgi:hypothetical protein